MATQTIHFRAGHESINDFDSDDSATYPIARLNFPGVNLELDSESEIKSFPSRNHIIAIVITVLIALVVLRVTLVQNNTHPEEELHLLTTQMVQDTNWSIDKLNRIFFYWNALNQAQKNTIKQKTWFIDFSTSLNEIISKQGKFTLNSAYIHVQKAELLNTLAIVINPNQQTDVKHSRWLDSPPDIKESTAQRPAKNNSQISSQSNTQNFLEKNITQENRLAQRKDYSAIKESETTKTKEANTAIESNSKSETSSYINTSIAEKQIHAQVNRKPKATTLAQSQPRHDNSETWSKPVKLEQSKHHGTFKISSGKSSSNNQPTDADLNNLIKQYIKAYEKGDSSIFLELFSYNARTNTQSGLQDIRQEYNEIFSITSKRKLHINNVKWQFKKNVVKGTGNFTTSSINISDDDHIHTSTGKIQIIAKKLGNGILITHLYKTVNES